jgi:hypothetical protein
MKVRIPLVELQTAMYALLGSYGQEIPVYDDVPADAAYPYITLGAYTCKPVGAKGLAAFDVSQQVHIWSDYQGKKEVNSIADDISSLLTSYKLDLAAIHFNVLSQDVDFFEAFDEDELGYHGVITFIAKIQDLGGV